MSEHGTGSAPAAFVVRVGRDEAGHLVGVVERVRTGEKERFHDAAAIGLLITEMLADRPDDAGGSEPSP